MRALAVYLDSFRLRILPRSCSVYMHVCGAVYFVHSITLGNFSRSARTNASTRSPTPGSEALARASIDLSP